MTSRSPKSDKSSVGQKAFNRRDWLKTSFKTTSATALSTAAPSIVPATVFGANAPSHRITLGLIGCGHQSQRIVPAFLAHADARIVAVCDVNRESAGYWVPDAILPEPRTLPTTPLDVGTPAAAEPSEVGAN